MSNYVYTDKDFNADCTAFFASAGEMRALGQKLLVNVLLHSLVNGEPSAAQRLIDRLDSTDGDGINRAGIFAWMRKFCPFDWTTSEEKKSTVLTLNKKLWHELKKDGEKQALLEEAKQTNWWALRNTGKSYKGFGLLGEVLELNKKADKALKKAEQNPAMLVPDAQGKQLVDIDADLQYVMRALGGGQASRIAKMMRDALEKEKEAKKEAEKCAA